MSPDILDIPRTEIDALFHGENWTPRESFLGDVRALVDGEAWVTEWQYSLARPLLAERADLLIWLDLPFLRVALPRVIRRTVRRRRRRQREPPRRRSRHRGCRNRRRPERPFGPGFQGFAQRPRRRQAAPNR